MENYVSFECVPIDWNLLSERSCGRLDLIFVVFESARDFYCSRLLINLSKFYIDSRHLIRKYSLKYSSRFYFHKDDEELISIFKLLYIYFLYFDGEVTLALYFFYYGRILHFNAYNYRFTDTVLYIQQ